MSISQRPDSKETDEDLQRFQEEFLRQQEIPSVKLVKTNEAKLRNCYVDGETSPVPHTSLNIPCRGPSAPSHDTSRVQEKPPSSSLIENVVPQISSVGSPVPISERVAQEFQHQRKKSLFALRMEKSRSEVKENSNNSLKGEISSESSYKFGDHSYIITGKEAQEIHQQNVAQLSKLSKQEIEEERQRILSQLSSSTIKFLESRRLRHQDNKEGLNDNPVKPTLDSIQGIKTFMEEPEPSTAASKNTEKKKVFSNSYTSAKVPIGPENPDTCPFSTLPINPNETKQWLHMNILETDKLEWMKELPPVEKCPQPQEPYAARFNFQGMLLPYNDEKIKVNEGLHHHGDEPERPGYTLQELMQLSRSSVQQQRIMSLNVLGNILQKSKLGLFDKVLQQNILKELLDAGIFLLLRFSMDDISPPVVIAALKAMRDLLCNDPDEASLDYILGCEGCLQQPLLEVPCDEDDTKKVQEQKDHERELKDFQIIQLDVLKGAIRSNMVVRLGFILDVVKGPPDMVLDLLIRIARHSQQMAEAIMTCGGLLRTVCDQLLTTQVVSSLAAGPGQPGYGEPSAKALKLIRILACHSRTFANTLLEKFCIMEPVMTYVSMSSPELPHLQGLVVQGFYLWQTLMSYGLASQSIIDLYPILMRQLHFHAQLTSAVGGDATASGHELATALFGVIERAADIVINDHNILEPKPVFQLSKLVVDCLRKWLSQLSANNSEIPSWSCSKMIGAALNCLAKTADCAEKQDFQESRSVLEKLESFNHEFLLPFLNSTCFQKMLKNLKVSSYFLNCAQQHSKRDPSNLPSLGAMEWGGESLVPGLRPEAPFSLLSGLFKFLLSFNKIYRSSFEKIQSHLFSSSSLSSYIQGFVTKQLRNSNHWFCRLELYMLHSLILLIVNQPSSICEKDQAKYFQLAFRFIDLVQTNDKWIISHLLPTTLFSQKFFRWGRETSQQENLDLVEECLLRLPAIKSLYLDILGVRFYKVLPPSQQRSLTSPLKGTEPALPIDWHFAPLLLLYGQYNAQNRSRCSEYDTTSSVVSTLQYLFLTERLWRQSSSRLSVTARWCRLALVFLSGSDLFLDNDVKTYLKANLSLLLLQREKLKFREIIPGLTSFYDLYGELLLQYAAVSYGDKLFGAFLLLPLQQKQDPQLKRMVWGEHAVVLRLLSTPIHEVGVPIDEYLEPCETDPSLLLSYLELVAKGHVVEARCPVLHQMAVHHVVKFIHQHKDDPTAALLLKRINCLGNKNIQRLFLERKNDPLLSTQ